MIRRFCTPALAAMLAFTMPMLAPAAPVDASFATAGLLSLPWPSSNLAPDVVAIAPDGGIFVVHEGPGELDIVRLDAQGNLVSSYSGAGIARISLAKPFGLSAAFVEADGALLLGGSRDLMRVTPGGRIDEAFGDHGRLQIHYVNNALCAVAGVRRFLPTAAGARYVFATYRDGIAGVERGCAFVARLAADGTMDTGFGELGNIVRPGFIGFDAQVRADGTLELIGRYAGQNGQWVERLTADGRMELSFGAFGTLQLPDNGPLARAVDGAILADGSKVFVSNIDQPTLSFHRYRADHTPDPAFAGVGRSVLPLRDGTIGDVRVLATPDGGFLARGNALSGGLDISAFYKIDARGIPDRKFGDGGYFRHLAAARSRVTAWAIQPDGYVVFSAVSFLSGPPESPVNLLHAHAQRLQAVPDIVEFRNAASGHYFIAYDGAEARGIDLGAAGPGWSRTGEAFTPGGPSPVCRFYTAGANSHFFTIEPGECEEVKQSPGWTYEGLGFHARRLEAGACAPGLVTVHRLFNDRAAVGDSNHRYVTRPALIAPMVAAGWVHEGPVFCTR